MADPSIPHSITPNQLDYTSLPIPPLDPSVFCEDFSLNNDFVSDIGDFVDDVGDFNFNFDDLYLPSENEDFLTSFPSEDFNPPDPGSVQIYDDSRVSNSSSPEPGGINYGLSSDQSSSGAKVLNSSSPEVCQVSGDWSFGVDGFLNVESPPEVEARNAEVSGPASSQGSGNCGSDVSEPLNYASSDSGNCARSAVSSPNCANDNSIDGIVDRDVKLEDAINSSLLKRKSGNNGDLSNELRMSKYRRSNDVESPIDEEEEKRKARLMRNRESAQLSRQRKKHYVEELEDKLRSMVSQVQDMSSRISYLMAENANLRQHLSGGAPMCPPPPGMYPHPPMAPMGYPWMPYPPYAVKPNGSQVPLVPIPKLKPQPSVSVPKVKKVEGKKSGGSRSRKVASISLIGLLLFVVLFGGLIPMVNVDYGDMSSALPGRSSYFDSRVHDQHGGWDFPINRHGNDTEGNLEVRLSNEKFTNRLLCGRGHPGDPESEFGPDESVHLANASEPMVASLYVPRNDKLEKIDGNLIIHSILASEKAMASHETHSKETGLAVGKNLAPVIPGYGSNTGRRNPHLYRNPIERRQRALDSDNKKSKAADGKLQEWFREGLAGPLLHTGMCTEVFQFDVSPTAASSGAIVVPATTNNKNSVVNISSSAPEEGNEYKRGKNRRILHGLGLPVIPLPGSVHKENGERNSTQDDNNNFNNNNNNSTSSNSLASSMVVSVLVDPRDVVSESDGVDGGVMGSKSKSIPRIFVVVLIDSIKYVTYSCMLPLIGSSSGSTSSASAHHLVTTYS